MFDLIKKLSGEFGVSGNEEEIRTAIIGEIKGHVDDIKVDALGNLIAVKRGNGKKMMFAAHMDEIGVIATHIDDKGFIRFAAMGWVSQFYAIGQRVKFRNGTTGVVFYEEKLEEMKDLKLSKMYIDIGAKSREDTEKKVKIGDTACFIGNTVREGDMVISKALDNRCGCAILINAIKNLPETSNELYFVFTVQEELGTRGAKTSAYQIQPDVAIALDVTDTGDTPECSVMEVKLGAGPAIKIKDHLLITHPEVRKLLENAARKLEMPYQLEILESGGTDAGAIHLAAGGVPSGAVSIPCRYIHSPSEMANMNDIEDCVKLVIEAIKEY